MDLSTYQKLCALTAKKFDNREIEIMTWGLGIAGEAGDVASCIKKTFAHGNTAITSGIKENLGDTMWYLAMICNYFNWDLQQVLEENVTKLNARYPDGFTLANAQRAGTKIDWNEK